MRQGRRTVLGTERVMACLWQGTVAPAVVRSMVYACVHAHMYACMYVCHAVQCNAMQFNVYVYACMHVCI